MENGKNGKWKPGHAWVNLIGVKIMMISEKMRNISEKKRYYFSKGGVKKRM